MSTSNHSKALQLLLILSAIFIASLVACNLIFKKFFYWQPIDAIEYTFIMSVGILPYPITFLVTDLISELYGRSMAQRIVVSGFVVSLFILLVISVAEWVPSSAESPLDNETFSEVFGTSDVAIISSMLAYLIAQFIDVRIYHFWKRITNGKMLWLRNNFSTIPSQLIDTSVVLLILCMYEEIPWDSFGQLLLSGFLFKVIIALLDTPILYGLVYWARKHFNLKPNEEILLAESPTQTE